MEKSPHNCCEVKPTGAHGHEHKRVDVILWGSLALLLPAYLLHFFAPSVLEAVPYAAHFGHAVFNLANTMWWGVALGILFVGLLSRVPRDVVMGILGRKRGINGILRATFAGMALDLCSHGILLVGMKLYERGASLGQLMAFLIASPWNSFSLTLILWSLIGIKWTLLIIALSLVIAIISGLIFEFLVKMKVLPDNPNRHDLPDGFRLGSAIKTMLQGFNLKPQSIFAVAKSGFFDSIMILRWLLLGTVLAGIFQSVFDAATFKLLYGATLIGLGFTLITATLIEVCSEGSAPIAADIFTRAEAPGNAFAFMMAGVSTDYTEIMSLKETTKSWKIALFLPLITLPQVVFIALLIQHFSH